MASNDIAGRWLRVSSDAHDEVNQEPQIDRWIADHGYEVGPTYRLHGKSASKGKQQAALDQVLDDMRAGVITVLVVWNSARIERRVAYDHFVLAHLVRDAGGRIEYVMEPWLNETNNMSDAFLAMQAGANKQFSDTLSKNVRIAHDRIRANGGILGAVPWGFDIVGEKYNKQIVPTDLCKRVVPLIFAKCIAGDSLRTIAAWLDSQGIPTPSGKAHWHETSVRHIILSRAYAGRLQNKQGQTIARCEPVVPANGFDLANQALTSRPHRGPANTKNKPLLSKLRCANCGSPMYRVARRKSGRSWVYYRCYGSGAQRKGCGNMVPYRETETIIAIRIFLTSTKPHQTKTWVAGENWDSQISELAQDIRELSQDPLAEGFLENIAAKQAELADYTERNKNREKGRYEYADVLHPDGSVKTEGDHFYELDAEGRRQFLTDFDIRVENVIRHDPDAPKGIRVVINDEDHGVFPDPSEIEMELLERTTRPTEVLPITAPKPCDAWYRI